MKLPEITDVQVVTGEIDELITIYARDVDHLKEIIWNKLGQFPEVTSWSTAIVLDERSFPLTRRFHSKEGCEKSGDS